MNKSKQLKRLIEGAHRNRAMLITAAVVVAMITAAVFVYANGNNENITVDESMGKNTSVETETSDTSPSAQQNVYVDIGGCVKKPGVYDLPYGSRVFELVEQAGGFTKDADTTDINQAETVTDGMKITVPSKSDKKENDADNTSNLTDSSPESGLININTADSQTLQQVSGIGPVTAEKIISYREMNGPFKSTEDLMNISGIGEKTYQKMKSQITC